MRLGTTEAQESMIEGLQLWKTAIFSPKIFENFPRKIVENRAKT
jgi:hypothetical protein